MTNDLERWFFANEGRLCSKWLHYFEVYERHFARFRGTSFTFVEIGVQGGGSIDMWRSYFGPNARIVGADISPDCRLFVAPNTEIYIGDQGDPAFLRDLVSAVGPIDVLLDDGGHTMHQQITTFEHCFPSITANGVYVCEDTHTSYWPPYGGGLRAPGSFLEYMKGKVDELHGWHQWEKGITDFTRTARNVCFYDSMVVIEKAAREKPVSWQTGQGSVGRLDD
jgi:hypothetical protein